MAINILPEVVANQIAAGEVVNRPASVVKELLENAIDANASTITLNIQDAGRTLIEVIDNGCGMDEEDCRKCFLAHATSKIHVAEDLNSLSTMGFRGEALASIAAISQVELKSKQEGQDLGTQVIIEGGKIQNVEPTICSQGTSIKVKNIFFNVPARRNFLKSDNIEFSHIQSAFFYIALVHNDISFALYSNGKVIYNLQKASKKKRISDIYGEKYNQNLVNINEVVDVVKIEGFVSKPDLTKKNKNEEYFFVNKRFMKSPYLANAVERAYQGLIADKTYPVFFINLSLDPKNIDVNIHPTKTEIKFLDEKIIYSVLYAAVRKALGMNTLSNQLDFEKKDVVFPAKLNQNLSYQPKISYNNSYNPFASGVKNTNFYTPKCEQDIVGQSEISFSREGIEIQPVVQKAFFEPFQFLNKYIVTCMQDSIIFISQHFASVNILYNKFINKKQANVSSQRLLLCQNHRFSPNDTYKILENSEKIKLLGYELQYKNDNSFDITAIPSSLSIQNAIEILEDYLQTLDFETTEKDRRNKLCLSMARRMAIREEQKLEKEEITKILSDLFSLPVPDRLPNGQKVMFKVNQLFLDNYIN